MVDLDQDIDFIGKEALKKIKEKGISNKLIGLEIDGDPIHKVPENFWPIYDDNDKKIGRVSRCVFSPRLNRNIGLAIIDVDHSEPGNPVSIESPRTEHKLTARVHELPWFPAEKNTNLD